MHTKALVAIAASAATASASAIQGFNYGSTNPDGSVRNQQDFQSQFEGAKKLAGTNGAFTAARLYTTIQGGSQADPISAIPAAIDSKTRLLLGLWASSGDATMNNEITALKAAMTKYGKSFTDLVDGISVGSEDLYRITETSLKNDPQSVGIGPDLLVTYINKVRDSLKGTALSGAKLGHVDTWTAWANDSNSKVADALDWVGTDAYPYFQDQMENSIQNGKSLFDSAWQQTKNGAKGKPVWITETAWPIGGKTRNLALPNVDNAQKYWQEVGCNELFGKVNTYWFTYYDGNPDPRFGLVDSVGGKPRFDLDCSKASKPSKPSKTGAAAEASGTGSSYPSGTGSSGSPSNGTTPSSGSGSGSPGVPPAPTSSAPGSSSSGAATGAASTNVVSFFGILGAAIAAIAAY